MPSPFPGMDPKLENPDSWSTVHSALISEIRESANSRLPPGYVARIGERTYVVSPARNVYPDGAVLRRRPQRTSETDESVAVCDPAWEVDLGQESFREPYVEIRTVGPDGRLVTVVEVLSPSNKTPGEGRDLYLKKQHEVIASSTQLLEIDLLRRGKHTVFPPRERLQRYGEWDYLVSLSRAEDRSSCTVSPVTVRDRLPKVLLPLDAPDADLVLDLQSLMDRVYDKGRFAEQIAYATPPAVPLSADDTEWAEHLLREPGLPG